MDYDEARRAMTGRRPRRCYKPTPSGCGRAKGYVQECCECLWRKWRLGDDLPREEEVSIGVK